MNKTDLTHKHVDDEFLPISAKDGSGLEQLRNRLAKLLGEVAAGEEGVMVTRSRHRLALQVTLEHIESGLKMLGPEEHLDLVALEWRRAWTSLGEILGIGDVELILDRVFSEFCIGK
jgi:tRNA modification GTPase